MLISVCGRKAFINNERDRERERTLLSCVKFYMAFVIGTEKLEIIGFSSAVAAAKVYENKFTPSFAGRYTVHSFLILYLRVSSMLFSM